jgi:hypothetical protein
MGAWSTLFGVADSSRNRRNQVEVAAAAVAAIVESEQIPRWGGSVPGHIVHYRDRKGAFTKLCRRYFNDVPEFDDRIFQRR